MLRGYFAEMTVERQRAGINVQGWLIEWRDEDGNAPNACGASCFVSRAGESAAGRKLALGKSRSLLSKAHFFALTDSTIEIAP